MKKFLKVFRTSEEGAVTVDWVVLTAAVVSLAVVAIVSISGATGNVGDGVGGFLTGFTIGE